MKSRGNPVKAIKYAVSFLLVSTALFCICRRLPECFASQNPAALAAALTLADGTYKNEAEQQTSAVKETTAAVSSDAAAADEQEDLEETETEERDKTDYYDSYSEHDGEEKYVIEEKTYGADGVKCGSAYVKNKTGLDIDFTSISEQALSFEVEAEDSSPQVLIYHTHTSEAYIDEDVDFFYDSFYSRTQNNDFNVTAVGDAIAQVLNEKGITTIHDKTVHDSTYNGAYDRSVQTVESVMDEYEDIKVVIDIHRDAIGSDERKIKPVFEYNGVKGAQIMILAGCDYYNEMGFENWKSNLNFALKIQNTAESLYPGMTRPLDFDFFVYNEYVCDGSLLIEVGTDANSIDEAVYSGALLGNVLYEVLK